MALSRLGAATITAITDSTAEAILCNTFFDDLADEVMLEGSWTSTIKRSSLAKTTNTPTFEYANEFQLPVDPFCLKVLNIDEDVVGNTPYQIEGDKLLTDSGSIKIRYIGRLSDTEDWDPLLRQAFTARLASELAYAITGDQSRANFELERYFRLVNQGLALNGQQGSKEILSNGEYIEVR
jgi:hypothetical protein